MLPDPPIAHVEVDLYLHVRVLISIILGLSVTRLLGGLAQFMQQSDRPRLSWIHLAWVAWVLLNVVSFWWWEFSLSHVAHWTFALYLFVIAYASTFFLQAALLFPADIAGYEGYGDYLLARRAWFFGIIAATQAMDVVDTLIKGQDYLRSLGPEYPVEIGVSLVLCAVAMRTRNLIYHSVFAALGLLYQAAFIYRYFFGIL